MNPFLVLSLIAGGIYIANRAVNQPAPRNGAPIAFNDLPSRIREYQTNPRVEHPVIPAIAGIIKMVNSTGSASATGTGTSGNLGGGGGIGYGGAGGRFGRYIF